MPSKDVQLWSRDGERKRSADKLDPVYLATLNTLLESKKHGQLTRRKDGFYSDVVSFRSPVKTQENPYLRAEAHIAKDDNTIRIAIGEGFETEGRAERVKSYQMNPQGIIIDLDSMHDLDPVTSPDDFANIIEGLEAVRKRERYDIEEKQDQQRRIRRGIGKAAVGITIVGGLTLGVIAGVKAWIIDPAEAADAYREEFNQSDYGLPGESVNLDYHEFNVVPVDEFNDIPTYGGIDEGLSSPRTFDLGSDGCVSIDVAVSAVDDLTVGLPENSPYIGYHFETSVKESGFSICLTEDSPLESTSETVKIAVQVR